MTPTSGEQISTEHRKNVILAGKAIFTLVSHGQRRTYNVSTKPTSDPKTGKEGIVSFIGVLSGPDNTSDSGYMAVMFDGGPVRLSAKSNFNKKSIAYRLFNYAWEKIRKGQAQDDVEFIGSGKCARCGRLLTTPESVAMGLGPECASRMIGG